MNHAKLLCPIGILLLVLTANRVHAQPRTLHLTLQNRDPNTGQVMVKTEEVDSAKVAVVVVDPWNFHWCKTATMRVDALIPRMNKALEAARSLGMTVMLCPSDVVDNYAGWPQRETVIAMPKHAPPPLAAVNCPAPPDGGGCACGSERCIVNYGWDGMHPSLHIAKTDLIPDTLEDVWTICKDRKITHLIYMGVHTQVCLLGKPMGLRNLKAAGMPCILARDITDAHPGYNPATGFTPDGHTAEVVAHFERYLAPTINMAEELAKIGKWDPAWVVDPVRIAPWGTTRRPHLFEKEIIVTLSAPWQPQAEIRYTTDGTEPGPQSTKYEKPLAIDQTTRLRVGAFEDGRRVCLESEGVFDKLIALPPQPDVHLSDLTPLRVVGPGHTYGDSVRFAAHSNPPRKDESNEGNPLQLRGVKYAKGLGVHAINQMIFQLQPDYARFVALVGVDEHLLSVSNGSNLAMHPSVVFKVFIDGQEAAASPVMRIAMEPWRFDVQIPPGSKIISLATMDGGDGNKEDRANWVQCGFVRVGQYYAGEGDIEYLQLLDIARRMFAPDPEFQNLAMLYDPDWNGLVEGPTWKAWWTQNSYGPTYCALPFYQEPFVTFLQNAQNLWFDQMGDGERKSYMDWVAPDGCLCDGAAPGLFVSRQGDGRVDIHDWALEFTGAGLLNQSELLLIGRDPQAIAHYLPKLRRCANFIETRRDPSNNLFLAGPAANLLGPSYSGWKKPDGTFDKAYLTGLSITYIAALDRLIELEKLAGDPALAQLYTERRDLARKGLPQLTTEEGYFLKSLDPDGTRHGVYGAAQHGYFEATCNHDAICFRVADDAQAEKIYAKITSIPGLRPHDLIVTNYPGLDDLYQEPTGLFTFGHWVNGGHWSTCEARMMMGYYRLGKHDDARRSMQRILGFARRFRMDNNLTDFGSQPYQPGQPINCVVDCWGIPAALIRGLFEYLYRADGVTIIPHIPPGITRLEQHFPIRFGSKRLYLATTGRGPITSVVLNGQPWQQHDATSVKLPYDQTPDEAVIQIALGDAKPEQFVPRKAAPVFVPIAALNQLPPSPLTDSIAALVPRVDALRKFHEQLLGAGLGESYEAAHARLVAACLATSVQHLTMVAAGQIPPLPPESQAAADKSYMEATARLCDGLERTLQSYGQSRDPHKRQVHQLWLDTKNTEPTTPNP